MSAGKKRHVIHVFDKAGRSASVVSAYAVSSIALFGTKRA
jgi:hypothetical protein